MNKQGFTLTEVLTTVLIIGILTSIAMPKYMRAVERARATEAMSSIKALNDSIYAYYTDKETCPERFNQLVAKLPSHGDNEGNSAAILNTKNFKFGFVYWDTALVPGTDCNGAIAIRRGSSYSYAIWNPYTRGTTGEALALQCAPMDASDERSKAICESLGLYREGGAAPTKSGQE